MREVIRLFHELDQEAVQRVLDWVQRRYPADLQAQREVEEYDAWVAREAATAEARRIAEEKAAQSRIWEEEMQRSRAEIREKRARRKAAAELANPEIRELLNTYFELGGRRHLVRCGACELWALRFIVAPKCHVHADWPERNQHYPARNKFWALAEPVTNNPKWLPGSVLLELAFEEGIQ